MGRIELPAGHSLSDAVTTIVQPTAIRLDKKSRLLAIAWSDGSNSEYAWDALREGCPCALCRSSEDSNARSSPFVFDLTPVQAYELEQVELVGNYALKLVWNDGHSSGIYTWDYLHLMSSR